MVLTLQFMVMLEQPLNLSIHPPSVHPSIRHPSIHPSMRTVPHYNTVLY
jgi:hypothetical protein